MILGLTGHYCSGKSTVEKILTEDLSFESIDVDKIGHIVLEENRTAVIDAFGNSVIDKKSNKINRKYLGKIVFNDVNQLKKLNDIVHPKMIEVVKSRINKSSSDNICINAALLFEMGLYKLCCNIIVVKSSIFNTFYRAKKRDNASFCKILKILKKQKVCKLSKKYSSIVDTVYIRNNRDFLYLEKEINRIFFEIGGISGPKR